MDRKETTNADTTPVVFVVDDDESVRNGLSSLLRSVGYNVTLFASASDFLEHQPINAPCCLVLDIRLPGLSGLGLQAEMARRERQMPIIIITGHGDVPMSVRALKAGAIDFLSKPFREQDILDSVSQAIAIDTKRRFQKQELSSLLWRYQSLTEREREILAMVNQGLMNKQIAGKLGLSEITVKVHRGQVMRKMDAGSLADLVKKVEHLRASGCILSERKTE
jgi:FixJ family two-component response regulator